MATTDQRQMWEGRDRKGYRNKSGVGWCQHHQKDHAVWESYRLETMVEQKTQVREKKTETGWGVGR